MRTRSALALVALSTLASAAIGAHGSAPASRLSQGNGAACIPIGTDNRQVRVRAQINGRDSLWLTVDTGASSSALDGNRAAALGLRIEGTQQSQGAGGPQEGSMAHGVDLRLPGFELLDRTIDTLPLEALGARAGLPLDGILGFELFSRRVVEIDYARSCMLLHEPEGYVYRGGGAILPLQFLENHPYVTARVVLANGRSFAGRFVIDTGSSGALIFSPDAVARERVLDSMDRTLAISGHGVGGAIETRLGRVGRLELGRFRLAAPLATLQPAGTGLVSAQGTAGNIGGGILSRFKVIFDYARRRMILEPNARLGEPFEVDMSGLSLVTVPPDYRLVRVARVIEASPAFEAGIQAGDEIKRLDGKAAEGIGLPALREMLRREGREVRLELRRGAERVAVTLRTRRLI